MYAKLLNWCEQNRAITRGVVLIYLNEEGGIMKKMNVVKYGVFLVVSLSLMGAAPGCSRLVNLYNNLVMGGEDFTAKLECSSGTWESVTSQLSPCNPVVGQVCDCRFSADGDFVGTFSGCFDISTYCEGDATIILKLNGENPGLFIQCVTTCGDSISGVSESIELEEIPDFSFILEEGEEVLELFNDK